jgi:hypothetical protein
MISKDGIATSRMSIDGAFVEPPLAELLAHPLARPACQVAHRGGILARPVSRNA